MKIFVTPLTPLHPELGAPQIAMNLTEALRERGHEVTLWEPPQPPPGMRSRRVLTWQIRHLERFLADQPPFEVVDVPAVALTRLVAGAARVAVARSVQPDLRYLAVGLGEDLRTTVQRPWQLPRLAWHTVHSLQVGRQVVSGWHRATRILCLGSLEESWMRRRFPWLRPKLACYVAAPSGADRERLAQLRSRRGPARGLGVRFLWIGRWVAHKGLRRLIRFVRSRSESHPYDTFTVAGTGRDVTGEMPAELVTSGRVRVIPHFSREELFTLLESHDAGLFTSIVEGWGLVVQEMLEAGLVLYCSVSGAIPDLRAVVPEPIAILEVTGTSAATPQPMTCLADEYSRAFSWSCVGMKYEQLIITS